METNETEMSARIHIAMTAALNGITVDEALDQILGSYEYDGLEIGIYTQVAELIKQGK